MSLQQPPGVAGRGATEVSEPPPSGLPRVTSNPDINGGDARSDSSSSASTAQSSRSPTPEIPYGYNLLDIYMERLGIRKAVPTKPIDLQTASPKHINDLPMDVISPIVNYLDTAEDLLSFMLVQRRWLTLASARIWYKPMPASKASLEKLCQVLASETCDTSLDYASLVHRLNLSQMSRYLTDKEFSAFLKCTNIDRLVLSGCNGISPQLIGKALARMPRLQSVDMQDIVGVNDEVLDLLSQHCPDLQVFYGGGEKVTDEGLAKFSRIKSTLRRLILGRCSGVTAQGVVDLVANCRHLVELDVTRLACFKTDASTPNTNTTNNAAVVPTTNLTGFSDSNLRELLVNCSGLRDLRIDGSSALSASGFDLTGIRLTTGRMDSLRVLSLAMCSQLNDSAISQLVQIAPRIRHLNLSKCPLITDKGMSLIAETYGHGLHYLHLGHCTKITDRTVSRIAETCPRLSFFDAANCSNLTNISLIVLSRLPKLRRIGVVKCNEIGAPGVMALAQKPIGYEGDRPIERLHLSYCSSISIRAIKMVLDACPRLVHLSLTGVRAFMRADIMGLSRPPPPELNEHQRQVFCVFSGSGIADLRDALKNISENIGIGPWLAPPVTIDRLNQQDDAETDSEQERDYQAEGLLSGWVSDVFRLSREGQVRLDTVDDPTVRYLVQAERLYERQLIPRRDSPNINEELLQHVLLGRQRHLVQRHHEPSRLERLRSTFRSQFTFRVPTHESDPQQDVPATPSRDEIEADIIATLRPRDPDRTRTTQARTRDARVPNRDVDLPASSGLGTGNLQDQNQSDWQSSNQASRPMPSTSIFSTPADDSARPDGPLEGPREGPRDGP